MKNFELTEESIVVDGRTLYRIECIKDFKFAKVGDKGGFVEKEDNLSGEAWVSDNACVYDNARVYDNAIISGNARICGSAWVSDDARIYGYAWVSDNACVFGDARVFGDVKVFGNAHVCGDVSISGDVVICGDAKVHGNSNIFGGVWSESPLQIQGTKHFVNMCSHTELLIGCERHTLSFWKGNFKAIGREHGYTTKEIEEYHRYINLAIEMYA